MKLPPVIVTRLIVTLLSASNVLAQSNATPTAQNKPPENNGIIETRIHSNILEEDRSVIIHLPRNYSRGGLFVLYSLIERPALFQARFYYSSPVWRFDNLMVNKMSQFFRGSHVVEGFLYVSVGDKETDQMVGGFTKLADVLRKNRNKRFRWVADRTPYAVHQDNALISTSKGLSEWGKYLKELRK
jgi:hypothetical protein